MPIVTTTNDLDIIEKWILHHLYSYHFHNLFNFILCSSNLLVPQAGGMNTRKIMYSVSIHYGEFLQKGDYSVHITFAGSTVRQIKYWVADKTLDKFIFNCRVKRNVLVLLLQHQNGIKRSCFVGIIHHYAKRFWLNWCSTNSWCAVPCTKQRYSLKTSPIHTPKTVIV